jgi:hypothetical protein
VALQLTGEGLIQNRMRRILSITRRSIDAFKAAFGQSGTPIERLPALRMITHAPEPARESRRAPEHPAVPTRNPDKMDDDDLELHRICEAIGLDVREVTGEASPRPATPAESNDLSNDVSDDVLRLIEHVEATNAQRPGLLPRGVKSLEPATWPAHQIHAKSRHSANRQHVQTSFAKANDLADILASLKLRLLKIRLAPDDMSEAQAEITTAVAQLLSPRPKPQIIALSLKTLVAILEQAGPAALTKDVEMTLVNLRAFLLQLEV